MERTKFRIIKKAKLSAKTRSIIKRITLDEIMEQLSYTDKVRVLSNQTEIQARLINIKKDVYCIGELLYENRRILPHGMFARWIDLTFNKELPYSTAYFYMRVYGLFKDDPRIIQYIPTKYLLMVTEQKFPDEIIKTLKENPEKINNSGLQRINEVYQEFKNGTIGGGQFIKLAKEQIKLGTDIWKGRAKHRLNANMRLSLEFGAGDMLKRINSVREIARGMAGVYPYDPESPEHKELIKLLEDTIKGLQELKSDLEGGGGFWKPISTEDGDKYIENSNN